MSDKCPSCDCTAKVVKELGGIRAQCSCTRSSIESSEAEALSDWYRKAHEPENCEMKYIVVEDEWGSEVAIVFPKALQHAQVAGSMSVISGGFCYLDHKRYTVSCHGKSVSLDVLSREIDSDLVWKIFFKKPRW